MAAASMFNMSPYQWTNTAGLSMQGLQLAGNMAQARDKKVKQTTTTKSGGGSGIGGTLGSAVGSIAGSFFGPAGTMIGGALGGALGGAIDGGGAGAASGAAGGLGMGLGLAGSDTFTGAMGDMWGNLGIKGSQNTGGFDFSSAGKNVSANQWDNGYKGIDTSFGDSMALRYGPIGGLFR